MGAVNRSAGFGGPQAKYSGWNRQRVFRWTEWSAIIGCHADGLSFDKTVLERQPFTLALPLQTLPLHKNLLHHFIGNAPSRASVSFLCPP